MKTVYYTEQGGLKVLISDNASALVTLSNGSKIVLSDGNTSCPAITTLDAWNLTIEAHGPALDHASLEANTTTIDVGMLDHLAPWTQIPGIEHAGGIGTYRTRFEISIDNSTAILVDFGLVLHTMRAWLNGRQVPAIDPTNAVVDISDLAVSSSNVMEVKVTMTLFNAVKANVESILSVGHGPQTPSYYTEEGWQEFGMIGPVEIKEFRRISI